MTCEKLPDAGAAMPPQDSGLMPADPLRLMDRRSGVMLLLGAEAGRAILSAIFGHLTDGGEHEDTDVSLVCPPGTYAVPERFIAPCGRGRRMLSDALTYALISDRSEILIDMVGTSSTDTIRMSVDAALSGHRIWILTGCGNLEEAAGLLAALDLPRDSLADALLGVIEAGDHASILPPDALLGIIATLQTSGD